MMPPPAHISPGTEADRAKGVPPFPRLDSLFSISSSLDVVPAPALWQNAEWGKIEHPHHSDVYHHLNFQQAKCHGHVHTCMHIYVGVRPPFPLPLPPSHHGGVLVELVVRLPVLVLVLGLGLPASLLPHHGLLVVLPSVQAGALVDAHATHHLPGRGHR